MFAIRARRKVASERDFLDAVEKVVRQGTKFSSTYVCSANNMFNAGTDHDSGPCIKYTTRTVPYTTYYILNFKIHVSILISHLSAHLMLCRRALLARYYHRRAPKPSSSEITDLLARHDSASPSPLNLAQLLSFGHPVSPDSLLSSVSYALSELPRRLATRVRSLEALPFIVGTNPYVAKTLDAYRESFQWLATHPPVTTLQENEQFVEQLADLVQRHANDVPTMAKGYVCDDLLSSNAMFKLFRFQECSHYMSSQEISNFLDGVIRNRISVRLIAEQHIAVSQALKQPNHPAACVGVVDVKCSPAAMIRMCGSFVTELCEATLGSSPSIIIDGQAGATFA